MCGINGFTFNDEKLIKEMNFSIKHRGPDDEGYFCTDNLTLGQVRLSIIDLSDKGHQPMFYNKKHGASNKKFNNELLKSSNLSIVFNGEIYNYIELRDELIGLGYFFTTNTDTEVILAAYNEWSYDCVNKFNGMWAFCIHDKLRNNLFICRDQLGKKPLYYSCFDNNIIFSSELKSFYNSDKLDIGKPEAIDLEAINLFFGLGFIPAPYTVYNSIKKVEAGSYMIFDLNNRILTTEVYRNIPKYNPVNNHIQNEEDTLSLLEDAVKLRLRSDVPVGAFLSGGVDSSSVVGVMKKYHEINKLHTFSIGFEGKYDETFKIKILEEEFKTKHHHKYFKRSDIDSSLNDFFFMYDEPFADQSGFPTNMVSQMASKHVKVALSGDGGDEIFGGYPKHKIAYFRFIIRKYTPNFILWSFKSLSKLLLASRNKHITKIGVIFNVLTCDDHYYDLSFDPLNNFTSISLKDWFKKTYDPLLAKMPSSEAVIRHDLFYKTLPDNFLQKVDRASMYNGLEVRSPFLDFRFIELSSRIPSKSKTDLRSTKKILRKVVKDFIPPQILEDKSKSGFSPPFREWLKDQKVDYRQIYNLLENNNLLSRELNLFFTDKFENKKLIKDIYKIRLFIYYIWCKKWLNVKDFTI